MCKFSESNFFQKGGGGMQIYNTTTKLKKFGWYRYVGGRDVAENCIVLDPLIGRVHMNEGSCNPLAQCCFLLGKLTPCWHVRWYVQTDTLL